LEVDRRKIKVRFDHRVLCATIHAAIELPFAGR
jgi:hypothetical protein